MIFPATNKFICVLRCKIAQGRAISCQKKSGRGRQDPNLKASGMKISGKATKLLSVLGGVHVLDILSRKDSFAGDTTSLAYHSLGPAGFSNGFSQAGKNRSAPVWRAWVGRRRT